MKLIFRKKGSKKGGFSHWKKLISGGLALLLLLGNWIIFSEKAFAQDIDPPVTSVSHISGSYAASFTVRLDTNEPDAIIYYTTDGSDPTESSPSGVGFVDVPIHSFFTVLSFRAKDAAGNWEKWTKREYYKVSPNAPQAVAGTDGDLYYTDYVSADGGNLVYARMNYNGGWKYNEVHLVRNEGTAGATDTIIASNLPEEITFTGISGDRLIYGGKSSIHLYTISSGSDQVLYTASSGMEIDRVLLHGDKVVFWEGGSGDSAFKWIDLGVTTPTPQILDGDAYSISLSPSGNRVVWEESGNLYLWDFTEGNSPEEILSGHFPLNLILFNESLLFYDARDGRNYFYDLTSKEVVAAFDLPPLTDYDYVLDQEEAYLIFQSYEKNGEIGALNLRTGGVTYLDFDGEYSDLPSFTIDHGVAYWSKDNLYYDYNEQGLYIDKTPIYRFDLTSMPVDATAPSINPVIGPSFAKPGFFTFQTDEDVLLYYTHDGSDPSPGSGQTKAIPYLAGIPVWQSGTVKVMAQDFAGNRSAVETYQVTMDPEQAFTRVTDERFDGAALYGTSLVYSVRGSVYLHDLATKKTKLLFTDEESDQLDFDGRYVVYDTGWFESKTWAYDLATGEKEELPIAGYDFSLRDGKLIYVKSEGTYDDLAIYDLAAKRETPLHLSDLGLSIPDIDDPYLEDNLVVFEDWENDTAYLFDLNQNEATNLRSDGLTYISEAVLMDGKVYFIAEDTNFDKRLYVHDPGTGISTPLTDPIQYGGLEDLTVDKFGKKYVALEDEGDHLLLLVNVSYGNQVAPFDAGEFYPYSPFVSGEVFAFSLDYGMENEDLFYRLLRTDDLTPPTVTINVYGGDYNAAQTVTLSTDEAASIFYTLDGSQPTDQSPKYVAPLLIDRDTTLSYFAVDLFGNRSVTETVYYHIDFTPPTVSAQPPGGAYKEPQTVKLTGNEPATIYYSLNGGDTVTYSVYEEVYGIPILEDTILTYYAVDGLGNRSEAVAQEYRIDPDAPQVTIIPPAGTYPHDVSVTFDVYDETDAILYYTLDGSDPTQSPTRHEYDDEPILLSETTTVNYFAVDKAGNETGLLAAQYVIEKHPPEATVSPGDGATGVSVTAPLTATFDVPVTANDLDGITLRAGDETVSGVTASLNGRTLTITHPQLAYETLYTMTIPADTVRNEYGVGNEPIEWSFTTAKQATNPPNDGGGQNPPDERGNGGGNGSGMTPPTPPTIEEYTVTAAAGGTLKVGNFLEIIIPAGALNEDGKILYTPLDGSALPDLGERIPAGAAFELTFSGENRFRNPLTFLLRFDGTNVGDGQPALFYYHEGVKEWLYMGGKVNEEGLLEVEVPHFTKFAVLVQEELNLSDLVHHWAKEYALRLISMKAMNGFEDGTFRPDLPITRAQFVKILAGALGLKGGTNTPAFADEGEIPEWAKEAATQAFAAGWVKGYEEDGLTYFHGERLITRAEMAVIIARALGGGEGKAVSFADGEKIPRWAEASIRLAVEKGILSGYPDKSFRPDGIATRAEAVKMIYFLLDALNR